MGGGVSHLEQADTGLETRNNGLSEKLDLGIRFAAECEGRGAANLDLFAGLRATVSSRDQSSAALREGSGVAVDEDSAVLCKGAGVGGLLEYRLCRHSIRGQKRASVWRQMRRHDKELGRLLALLGSARG